MDGPAPCNRDVICDFHWQRGRGSRAPPKSADARGLRCQRPQFNAWGTGPGLLAQAATNREATLGLHRMKNYSRSWRSALAMRMLSSGCRRHVLKETAGGGSSGQESHAVVHYLQVPFAHVAQLVHERFTSLECTRHASSAARDSRYWLAQALPHRVHSEQGCFLCMARPTDVIAHTLPLRAWRCWHSQPPRPGLKALKAAERGLGFIVLCRCSAAVRRA
jgi:hypothetical protein